MRFILFLLLLFSGYEAAHAQWGACQCKYSPNGATACMTHLPQFTCKQTCEENASPGVSVISATGGGSCHTSTLGPHSFATLVEHTRSSICHQGSDPWSGPDGNTLLRGEALRRNLKIVQQDFGNGQEQAYREIDKASVQDLELALDEAIEKCQTSKEGVDFPKHLRWVWDHGGAHDLYADGQRKDYFSDHGVCHIFNNAQTDDNIKNVCHAFSGRQIQEILDSFGKP